MPLESARPGHVATEAANRRWLKGRRDLAVACLVTVITLLPDLFHFDPAGAPFE